MMPSVLAQYVRQGVEDFLRTTLPVSTPFFPLKLSLTGENPKVYRVSILEFMTWRGMNGTKIGFNYE